MDFAKNFSSLVPGNIINKKMLTDDEENLVAFSFVVLGNQHHVEDENDVPHYSGNSNFKIEQLELLGFKVVVVSIYGDSFISMLIQYPEKSSWQNDCSI